MDHPCVLKQLWEGDYAEVIGQYFNGDDDRIGVQLNVISSCTGLIREKNSGTIRKLMWHFKSENTQRERDAQNERNRARSHQETEI